MSGGSEPDGIARGRRLTRSAHGARRPLGEAVADYLERLTWRTWIGDLRLKGLHPPKLLASPRDPIAGDAARGSALTQGMLTGFGAPRPLAEIDLGDDSLPPPLLRYLHGFGWLRDLARAEDAVGAAESAQRLTLRWLDHHGTRVSDVAWRPDLCGHRIMAITSHAALLASSSDLVFRSRVLNQLARAARHLDRAADKAPAGAERIAAWCGAVFAGLVLPDGDARRTAGEAGLARALDTGVSGDGGLVTRSPAQLVEAIELMVALGRGYEARRLTSPPVIAGALAAMGPALLATRMGDDALGNWQGGAPVPVRATVALLGGSAAGPSANVRDWGYHRLEAAGTLAVIDAAPPPDAPVRDGACASTLAFELSDGPTRVVVNCGGAAAAGMRLGSEVAQRLRTTAAHSTLTLADRNSTALAADGSLGRGVEAVELARQEVAGGIRLEAAHDGYARRLGFAHRRQLLLSADGSALHGEDALLPAGRGAKGDTAFAIRFHLGAGVAASVTGDRRTAMLRLPGGAVWQMRVEDHDLAVDDSVWIDADGRPVATQQLVIAGAAPPGGTSVAWMLRRAQA